MKQLPHLLCIIFFPLCSHREPFARASPILRLIRQFSVIFLQVLQIILVDIATDFP